MARRIAVPFVESLEPRRLFTTAISGPVTLISPPQVSVTARAAAAYEGGPRTRIFVLRRTGDVSRKLAVSYTMGGTAKAGFDYDNLGSVAAFKAGYAIRKIAMTAIDDAVQEKNESVAMNLNATAAYTVNPDKSAAVLRILDNDTPSLTQTLSWSTKSPAKIGRSEAMVAAVGGKMYLFGGYTDGTATASGRVDTYDPATDSWSQVNTTMPLPATHAGCAVIGTDVYLAGGYHGGSGGQQTFASNQVWQYSTTTNTWTRMTDLPDSRGGGALVALDGQLHFLGGSDLTRTDRGDHWVLNLVAAGPGIPQWTALASLPTLRNHLGGVALNGKIYVVGGQQNQDAAETPQAALEVYDPATNKWATLQPLPLGRSHIAAATVVWNGRIVTFGGETQFLESINNVTSYDPATNKWTELTTLPGSRSSGAAAAINGVMYYTGGLLTTTTWKGTLS